MNLHQAFQVFLSYFAVEQQTIAAQKIEEIAKSENLDTFLEAEEDCKPGEVYYCTVHGFRSMDDTRCELNQFVVTKRGLGFSKGRDLPYIYRRGSTWFPPQLIVLHPSESASIAGYAAAIKLPYTIAGLGHDYPQGTLVVCLTMENEEVATGYANAIRLPVDYIRVYVEDLAIRPGNNLLPLDNGDIYIEHIDMLDTEYAAMLVDSPRF